MATTTTHAEVAEWLEERQGRFISISDQIWANPELGMAEYRACRLQSDDLAADGFTITGNIGDLPTAFMAEWTSGEGGPIIGFLGEYDALPGLSQKNQDVQDPLVVGGPGHGCGHNLLGTAALASASVLKAWLEHTGTPATVRYYGSPAEETSDGKVFMARAGAFDDLDMALSWHPGFKTTVTGGSSLAVNNITYRFRGRTAHAAANPETGRSALDAVELMNVGVNYLREHMPDQARIHYVITNGGGAPNVVPDDAEVWYFIRSPQRHQVEELTARVRKIAEGAALMTETAMEEHFTSGTYNLLYNDVIGGHLMKVLEELGPIEFTVEEHAFAKNITQGFPRELRASLLGKSKLPPELVDQGLSGDVWPMRDRDEVGSGSTDVSDVSWIAPTGQVTTTTWALGIPGHSWAVTATGAMSIGHKGMLHAAKTLAIAAAGFILDPAMLQAAKDEFAASTVGRPYQCPIPAHVPPPLP
jgi:aminobenzoyl-glutamate utilization protein B